MNNQMIEKVAVALAASYTIGDGWEVSEIDREAARAAIAAYNPDERLREASPNAETLARMGEAAEGALLSELGWYDAGKAAWLAFQLAEVLALPDDQIDTSDIPETTDWSNATRLSPLPQGDDT